MATKIPTFKPTTKLKTFTTTKAQDKKRFYRSAAWQELRRMVSTSGNSGMDRS
ncbi:MAG: hypothetical protein HQ582_33140 [Planctomycetes bacterium]|nr:hypothetical protein [Planctomycetota bacterium]